MSNYIGWDIGGAHIKVANVNNIGKVLYAEQYATPLWKGFSILEDQLNYIEKQLPKERISHGLTMTAELVDIFNSRKDGVAKVIDLCKKILGKNTFFYSTNYGLGKINNIEKNYTNIASANWHASASYVATLIESGLLIDIGSTTTDIIPFANNKSCPDGLNDFSRLCSNELVYTGVIRTPLMSLTTRVKFNGNEQGIVSENFANTADIYRILGYLNDSDDLMDAADGKGKSVIDSKCRLARMIGLDLCDVNDDRSCTDLAKYFHEVQIEMIINAVKKVLLKLPEKNKYIICAGVGQFLVKIIAEKLDIPCINFSDLVDCSIENKYKSNICASAVSIAQLNRISQIK